MAHEPPAVQRLSLPPSSHRTCGFPASGVPRYLCRRHAQGVDGARLISPRIPVGRRVDTSCSLPPGGWAVGSVGPDGRPILLGLVAQLVSQKREAFGHPKVIRSGIVIQAVLPSSSTRTYLAGPLRSTDITPLHRYYEPRRLPTRAAPPVMHSQRTLSNTLTRSGLPGSCLLVQRVPPPIAPESPTGAHARCFPVGGRLHHVWKAGHSHLSLTRPKRVHLIAAHVLASRGFAPRITPTHARSATCRTGNLQGKLLSACKSKQTFLAHHTDYDHESGNESGNES